MLKILIVDDSEIKVIEITKLVENLDITSEITVSSDLISARKALNETAFDILVLDQFLPIRISEDVLPEGGTNFLRELNQNRLNNIPRAIFGLSISEVKENKYYWPFFLYTPENHWFKPFKSLLNYSKIYNEKYGTQINEKFTWKIFVEGVTDFLILQKCISIFFAKYEEKLEVKYETGSGAAWVVRQLFATVFLLPKDNENKAIKSVAIFDNDHEGRKSIDKINSFIPHENAERKHFKIFQYKKQYSPLQRRMRLCHDDLVLEDLLPPSIWLLANENKWTATRPTPSLIPKDIKIDDFLASCKLLGEQIREDDVNRYIDLQSKNCISKVYKKSVIMNLLNRDDLYLAKALLPFKLLLSDIINYFEQ